ncbi:MAG: hypothetical protein JSS94_09025 [Bacteroidetes bacterium]|nr:hypothetical protein [Bacteroidota bacterium]
MKNRLKIYKSVITIIILTFFTQCRKGHISYNGIDFEKQKVYLFFRETKSKAGVISKSYNIHHSKYSHVGIGTNIGNQIYVFHILVGRNKVNKLNKSDLIKETISEFYNPKNEKVTAGEIFIIKGISKNDYFTFKKMVNDLEQRTLKFDKKFTTENDDNFYCSELVYYIINKISNKYVIEQTHKQLTGIDKIVLNRDSISYYPVDAFIGKSWVKSIKKW